MPYLNPMAMTEEDLALVKRAREVLSTAKVGEVCVLPPDLVAAMRDREIARMEEWVDGRTAPGAITPMRLPHTVTRGVSASHGEAFSRKTPMNCNDEHR